MSQLKETENKLETILTRLRQKRYLLEQQLTVMQSQQQVLLSDLQSIMDEMLILQGALTGSLCQFEEKAGKSQGLTGLYHGNPRLKHDIMQKRVTLEQSLVKLREKGFQLQQGINQLGTLVGDIRCQITPEIEHNEAQIEEIKQLMNRQQNPQEQPVSAQ